MDGAAPGAKIVSSRACSWGGGCTNVALTEGMIDLVANRGVDIVNMSIGGLPGAERRQQRPRRALQPAHRPPTASSWSSRPATAARASTPSATRRWPTRSSASARRSPRRPGRPTTARRCPRTRTLHNFSSRGPREDGGFTPNIIAPGLGDHDHPDLAARRRRRRGRLHAAGRLRACSTAPRWPPRRPPARPRCCSRAAQADGHGRSTPGAAAHALYTAADFIEGRPGRRAGSRPASTSPSAWNAAQEAARRRTTTRSTRRSTPRSPTS